MRFLVTTAMICVLFGVSYAQQDLTVHNIGKDKDGDTWYVDTSLTRKLNPPSDWITLMPIYTLLPGRALVFYFNVDCAEGTYQLRKAQSIDTNGRVIWEQNERSSWAKFVGYSGRGAQIVCKQGNRLPIGDGRIDE